MGEFDKTKKTIGVGGMDEKDRQSMFNKFISAGGQVVQDKEKEKEEKERQARSAADKKSGKSKSSGGSGSGDKRKSSGGNLSIMRGDGSDWDDDASSTKRMQSLKGQIDTLDEEMGSFFNRMAVKFKCWANNVTGFANKDLLPRFMSELNLEGKQALLELKICGNDILGNPQYGPKIAKELDKYSPIYIELIGRVHKLFDVREMNDLFADYNANQDMPVPISRVSTPIYSLFKKLYYLYPYQATIKKAILTAYDVLQRLENKPALIYTTKRKKITSEISVLFDKIFEKLYYVIIRNEDKNIPMVCAYMDNLLGIVEQEKPGKRRAGETLPVEAGGDTPKEEKAQETAEEEKKELEDTDLAYGLELMSTNSIEDLRKKFDQKNEYAELPDSDKALLSFLYFKEFDYEYSFILTTKKIQVKPTIVNGTKIDNKQKLLNTYELTRPCLEQFKIYVDVFKEQMANKSNPGSNYIEASKKVTQLEQKRGQQSRNSRATIKEYIEKSYEIFKLLIEDMNGAAEIIDNIEETIVFDQIESKKRLHRKTIRQCITDSYSYTYAFATRLNDGGDLYGGIIELTPEQMQKSFGKKSEQAENKTIPSTGTVSPAMGDNSTSELDTL